MTSTAPTVVLSAFDVLLGVTVLHTFGWSCPSSVVTDGSRHCGEQPVQKWEHSMGTECRRHTPLLHVGRPVPLYRPPRSRWPSHQPQRRTCSSSTCRRKWDRRPAGTSRGLHRPPGRTAPRPVPHPPACGRLAHIRFERTEQEPGSGRRGTRLLLTGSGSRRQVRPLGPLGRPSPLVGVRVHVLRTHGAGAQVGLLAQVAQDHGGDGCDGDGEEGTDDRDEPTLPSVGDAIDISTFCLWEI